MKHSHPSVVYGNGDNVVVRTPYLDGYNVILAGTSPSTEPEVIFDDGPPLILVANSGAAGAQQ